MSNIILAYEVREVPDSACDQHRQEAGGSLMSGIREDMGSFLRTFAAFPSASVTAAIRFSYKPGVEGTDPQARLTIHLLGQSHSDETDAGLALLMERGPMGRFYGLQQIDPAAMKWPRLHAACDVVRRQSILEPAIPPELNDRVPPAYYTIGSFEPRPDNDYRGLDRMLDRLDERVVVEVCMEPADTTVEHLAQTQLVSLLQPVNRPWDSDDLNQRAGLRGVGREDWGAELHSPRRSDPRADEVLRHYQMFGQTLIEPHLRFHIRVWAQSQPMARLITPVVGESAFAGGSCQLVDLPCGDQWTAEGPGQGGDLRVRPCDLRPELPGGQRIGLYDALSSLANLSPVDELVSVFRPPAATAGSPCCIRSNTDPPHVAPEDMISLGHDMRPGHRSSDGMKAASRGIHVGNLREHLFLVGVPKSGKTVTSYGLAYQLGDRNIPYLIIESGQKREYRRLMSLKDHQNARVRGAFGDLQIYTAGNEVSPLRINPLVIPEGISRDEHIENLLAWFKAGMPMGGPLPALLAEALERVYEDHSNPHDPHRMTELIAAAGSVLADRRYSADVDSDIRAALASRLSVLTRRSLGRMFQCGQNTPSFEQLITGRTIVELACLSPEQACLLVLIILIGICERIKPVPWSGQGVRLVIALEEAHNIVGRNTDASASEINADPKAHAAELVCRMLAELRAQGVAIVIIDQDPSAVARQVITHTGTKVAFRQTEAENREILAGCMQMTPADCEWQARLATGHAFLYTPGYSGPRLIRTPNLEAEWELPPPPNDQELVAHLRGERWYVEAAAARTAAELEQLERSMDGFDRLRGDVVEQAKGLISQHPRILDDPQPRRRKQRLADLARRARILHSCLESQLRAFRGDVYQPLVGPELDGGVVPESIHAWRHSCVERFDSGIEPAGKACLAVLEGLVRRCGSGTVCEQGV